MNNFILTFCSCKVTISYCSEIIKYLKLLYTQTDTATFDQSYFSEKLYIILECILNQLGDSE
jgi:hypothetical protein